LAIFRGKVSAAIKRFCLRGEKHGHRPAAPAREHLHRVHVDLVQIGSFFSIHLDIDEQFVHERGDFFVFE
jgi:hypothetical protein